MLFRSIDAARYQAAQGRVPVIILGPNEEDWYPELRAAVPSALFPLQAAAAEGEKPSAILTIALAARLHVAVANDCGGGHLMAAGLVPLVLIWGPPIFEKAPPQTKTLIPILCEQFGSSIEDIPVAAINDAVAHLLAAQQSGTAPSLGFIPAGVT